jgi:hypothetical protein
MQSTLYTLPILMILVIPQRIFEKFSYIKFHENPSTEDQVVPCGQTDGHDEASSGFSQFYERV